MASRGDTGEEALQSKGEASPSLSERSSSSAYEPVENSCSPGDSSDDGEEVGHNQPHLSVGEGKQPEGPHMQQRASTGAPQPSGELPSTGDLTHSGSSQTSIDATSSVSEGQAGVVASANSDPQPTSIQNQACAALPDTLADPDWQPTTSAESTLPPFTGQPGIQVETANFTALDFYELFFTGDLYSHIVEQSNLYVDQFIAKNPTSPLAVEFGWKHITVPEFRTFQGLSLLMGITKKSELQSYWSSNPIHHIPTFSAAMNKARYKQILQFMHFNDNELCRPPGDPGYDRLYKIRPLINHFNQKFADLFVPDQNICIDESLIRFSGRLVFEQFLPGKRARSGVKMYKLCDSATGYTCSFRVYEGKDSSVNPANCPDYIGSRGRIVWDLVSPLFGKGYHLYVGKSYTSVPLFRHLFQLQIGACGTVRPNHQDFPQRLVDTPLRRGERASLRCDELLAVRWKDKQNVFVVSSIHADTAVQITTETGVVEKPLCVHEHNLKLGGVDLDDQVMAANVVSRKARRWYKKVSVYLFNMALFNAYVLYKASGRTGSFLKFQEEIITALLYPGGAVTQTPSPDAVSRLHDRHFPDLLPATPTENAPQGLCRVCSKYGQRRDTRHYCPDCPDQPALCIGECFRRYHTLEEY